MGSGNLMTMISADTAHDPDDRMHDRDGVDRNGPADMPTRWVGWVASRHYHGRHIRKVLHMSFEGRGEDPLAMTRELAESGDIPMMPSSLVWTELDSPGDFRMFRATFERRCYVPGCFDDWSGEVVMTLCPVDDRPT